MYVLAIEIQGPSTCMGALCSRFAADPLSKAGTNQKKSN